MLVDRSLFDNNTAGSGGAILTSLEFLYHPL